MHVQPLTSEDGHRFDLRRTGHEAATGLLWLPALGVPARKYDGFAEAVAAQGIDVAVHEWRGLDSSSARARRGEDWDYAAVLRDLEASLAAMPTGQRLLFGGHSLGGQFAAMLAARHPTRCAGLVLVATGVPDPATFAPRQRWGVRAFVWLTPLVTWLFGYFPGQRLKFAGREAGNVMRDWSASARRARYAAYGEDEAMESRLARVRAPVLGLLMRHDWLATRASLDALVAKLGNGPRDVQLLDDDDLGTRADHFRWLRAPSALATRIAAWAGRLSP